jgi:hypothetical protein
MIQFSKFYDYDIIKMSYCQVIKWVNISYEFVMKVIALFYFLCFWFFLGRVTRNLFVSAVFEFRISVTAFCGIIWGFVKGTKKSFKSYRI